MAVDDDYEDILLSYLLKKIQECSETIAANGIILTDIEERLDKLSKRLEALKPAKSSPNIKMLDAFCHQCNTQLCVITYKYTNEPNPRLFCSHNCAAASGPLHFLRSTDWHIHGST